MEPTAPTSLDITTLVVAICAGAVALASLIWQFASWALAGGRAKVELSDSAFQAHGPAYISAEDGHLLDPKAYTGTFTRRALFVTVRSVGRMPVTVDAWHLKLPGLSYGRLTPLYGPPLPHRLDTGESATWPLKIEGELLEVLRANQKWAAKHRGDRGVKVRAGVTLGSGRKIKSRQGITLGPKELGMRWSRS